MKTPELPAFDHKPKKYNGPSADEVARMRKEFLNPGIFAARSRAYSAMFGCR